VFKNYIKTALRNIGRNKGFTTINILGLAIGMACCILVLLYTNDEFSFDRYPQQSDQIYRLVMGVTSQERGEISTARTPPPWAPALANDYPEVEDYVRFKTPLVSWLISYEEKDKRFHEKRFYFADPSVFDFFNFELIKGDPKTALVEPNTVVLTESAVKKYFGDENPINKLLRADNTYDLRIVGIMKDVPKHSHITFDILASFKTLSTFPIYGGVDYETFRFMGLAPDIYTYLQLKKGTLPDELLNKFPQFFDKYLSTQMEQLGLEIKPQLQPLKSIHLHSNIEAELQANSDINYIYIFSAIALFVLIIACINFMNLSTALSSKRASEVGLRKVVGAYRSQLIIQFLIETIFLTFIALFLAIILVQLLLPLFNYFSGKELSLEFTNPLIILGILGIVIFVGTLSGSYPAFLLSSFQPATVLKGGVKSGSINALLRKVLVLIQFSISIIFIIGTGIVYSQLKFIQNRELGFDKEQVVVLPFGDPRARQIYMSYENLIIQNPNVVAASGVSSLPGGLVNNAAIRTEGMAPDQTVLVEFLFGDHDFLDVMGIELTTGRNFSLDFPTDTIAAFILNETATNQFGWKDQPLEKRIQLGGFQGRVIGVVKDFHVKSLYQRIEPLMIHIAPNPDAYHYFAVKIKSDNFQKTLDFLEEKWKQVYPHDPFVYSFLDEDFDSQYQTEQLRGNIFISFSILAIFIACLGLFGLAAFTAEQRTKEIGIRKVLGASETGIVFRLSKEFTIWVLLANFIAWPVAFLAMDKWLQNFAYRTGIPMWIFFVAAVVALLIALITVSYQAIKAANSNPVEALRYE